MAPKNRAPSAQSSTPPPAATAAAAASLAASSLQTPAPRTASPRPAAKATASSSKSSQSSSNVAHILQGVWNNYVNRTPQRVKLLDTFMAFLVVVGAIQFVYCVLFGNFPFNAFLSGFSATVGQFVLTASLRIQTNPENKTEFETISNERAFADYVLGSLLLHFFCVNFIN